MVYGMNNIFSQSVATMGDILLLLFRVALIYPVLNIHPYPVEGSNSYDQLMVLQSNGDTTNIVAQYQTRRLTFYSITFELWFNLISIDIS